MTAASPVSVDRDALLAALVLAPGTYSRNRFFELYREPGLRAVRARASQLRSLVRHLGGVGRECAERVERHHEPSGRLLVRYGIGALGLRRTISLTPLEADVVDVAVARANNLPPPEGPGERVQDALRKLATAA